MHQDIYVDLPHATKILKPIRWIQGKHMPQFTLKVTGIQLSDLPNFLIPTFCLWENRRNEYA